MILCDNDWLGFNLHHIVEKSHRKYVIKIKKNQACTLYYGIKPYFLYRIWDYTIIDNSVDLCLWSEWRTIIINVYFNLKYTYIICRYFWPKCISYVVHAGTYTVIGDDYFYSYYFTTVLETCICSPGSIMTMLRVAWVNYL